MLTRVELEHGLVAHTEDSRLGGALGVLRHRCEGADGRDRLAGVLKQGEEDMGNRKTKMRVSNNTRFVRVVVGVRARARVRVCVSLFS